MITANEVQISTRSELLRNFSFNFQDGNIYLITAENGSGKTTLLRTMVGLLPADKGTILIDGSKFKNKKLQTFYWESSDWFNAQLTGSDYIKFICKQWQSEQSISKIINFWGMVNYVNLPIKKYSLGMKQRLVIALYEVSGAKNLFMDEISNGLDADGRKLLYSRLRTLADNGKCIVITSHYRDEIANYIDCQLAFDSGTLVEVKQ